MDNIEWDLLRTFKDLLNDPEFNESFSDGGNKNVGNGFLSDLTDGVLAPDRAKLQHDENGNLIRPDTYEADCFFSNNFITPELRVEMGYLASDFLKQKDLDQYASPRYFYDFDAPHDFCEDTLSLLICAARKDNEYARKLLVFLYQKFYKREYNQLKRFHILHFSDLPNFIAAPTKGAYGESLRTLFMADMMGIEIAPDCFALYQFFHEEKEFEKNPVFPKGVIDQGVLKDGALKKAEKLLPDLFPADDDIEVTHDMYEDLFTRICEEYDMADNLIDCACWDLSFEERASRAIVFLWDTFGRDFEYSPDDVAMIMALEDCVRGHLALKEAYVRNFEEYLGVRTSEDIKKPNIEIKSQEQQDAPKKAEPKENLEKKAAFQPEESVKAEISGLRLKLHERESTIQELRAENKSLLGQIEGLKDEKEERAKEQEELEALRKYVRSLEEEQKEEEVSLDEMKAALQEHKIAVIGGNQNWVKKLAQAFPGWRFISATVSPTVSGTSIQSMERIFFFTDTLSHSSYYKFMQIARNGGIPFSYIHGVNLDENIRWIYQEALG